MAKYRVHVFYTDETDEELIITADSKEDAAIETESWVDLRKEVAEVVVGEEVTRRPHKMGTPDYYRYSNGRDVLSLLSPVGRVWFAIGNILKYSKRAGHKSGESCDKDLGKADRYMADLEQALDELQRV